MTSSARPDEAQGAGPGRPGEVAGEQPGDAVVVGGERAVGDRGVVEVLREQVDAALARHDDHPGRAGLDVGVGGRVDEADPAAGHRLPDQLVARRVAAVGGDDRGRLGHPVDLARQGADELGELAVVVPAEALGEPDVAQPGGPGARRGPRQDHADGRGEQAGVGGAELGRRGDPPARRERRGEGDGGADLDRRGEAVELRVRVEQRQGDQPPVLGAEVRGVRHPRGDVAVVGLGQHDALGLRRRARGEHDGEPGARLHGLHLGGPAVPGPQAAARPHVRGGLLEGDAPQRARPRALVPAR